MSSYEDQIKQMYGANLTSQKEQLKSTYEAADQALTLQKEENQKITDSNLRQTRIDAQKSAVNNEEYYAASGLTSGAKAQAKLARDNQLLSDLTTIRTAQQEADALIERQRATLAKEYESAITKAQADNEFALAKALYEQAQKEDAQLLAKQEAAAKLMAEGGDYSLYQQIYGLSNWQTMRLSGGSAETLKTLDALHANNISETDRNAVLNTVQAVYDQMRAGGATQAELDNYLIGLHTSGILQKDERVDIRAAAPSNPGVVTTEPGTNAPSAVPNTDIAPSFDVDGYIANAEVQLSFMQKAADDWLKISQDYLNVPLNRLPEDVRKRVENYLDKYGSYSDLLKRIEEASTQKDLVSFAAPATVHALKPITPDDAEAYFAEYAKKIASEHHLPTPTITQNTRDFFKTTASLDESLRNGVTKEMYKQIIKEKIDQWNLTENEISTIEIAYKLYE